MSSTPGLDLLRGRPTPAIGTTEAKLQQRKLDALRRGIHRISDETALPYGIHVIGIGAAGSGLVETLLREAPDDLLAIEGSRLTALAIDVDDESLVGVRRLSSKWPVDRAAVETITLPVPDTASLQDTLQRYRDFLKLEYPMYRWDLEYEPWLPSDGSWRLSGESMSRAVAKAIYGRGYYDGDRPLAAALKRFARSVEATRGDAAVCIVFGLGDATGSGIALDLARHLSNVILGRRVLVTGIGIAPCEGDPGGRSPASLYPTLNELDCLCDETKNRGVVQSCGDLYKNPFTAGFLMVPKDGAWDATHDLAATQRRVNEEIASLLTLRRGANLWELLRLLNWVAAPSTQHSAARTPWGARWLHVFGFGDSAGGATQWPPGLGLLTGYAPEFIEMRVADSADPTATDLARSLDGAFGPEVTTQPVGGGRPGTVQFTLPRVAKTDLEQFFEARDSYEAASPRDRLLGHALLLEQGVELCEPSSRLPGMAGAGIGNSRHWIAVPLADVRGDRN